MTECENNCKDCGINALSQIQYDQLEQYIDSLPEHKGMLIDVLHKAQAIFGYLPEMVQEFVAEKLRMPVSKVYGVVRFYSFFTMVPKGKYPISVCMGTACYIKGAENVLDEFKRILKIEVSESTPDGLFSLDTLRCVGACGLAPVVLIGDQVHGKMSVEQVEKIISECREKQTN